MEIFGGDGLIYSRIDHDGNEWHYQNNIFHRLNGPAVIFTTGNKYWYQNGLMHRLDGPAIECDRGTHFEYWINGKQIENIPTDKLLKKEQLEIYITFM